MELRIKDYKKILDIIELLGTISDRAAMFRGVCEEMQKLVPFSGAALYATDPRTGHFLLDNSHGYIVPRESLLVYCLYYASLHPLVASGRHTSVTQAVLLTDVLSACRLADTEYFLDFGLKYGIFHEICISIKSREGMTNGIGLLRSRKERPFTTRERDIVNFLIPHFSRALHNIDALQKGIVPETAVKSRLASLQLSKRQQEVAFLVIQGLSNREIARRLYISEQTVKDHIFDIFETTKVRRRSELTAKLLGFGGNGSL